MNAKAVTEKSVKWWKPIVLGLAGTAFLTLFAFGFSEVAESNKRHAENAVWKSEVDKELKRSPSFDTLCSKEFAKTQAMFQSFMMDVDYNRRKDILVNSTQSAQIEMIAEKMKISKDVKDLQEKYEKLQKELETRAQIRKTKYDNYDTCEVQDKIQDSTLVNIDKSKNDNICNLPLILQFNPAIKYITFKLK